MLEEEKKEVGNEEPQPIIEEGTSQEQVDAPKDEPKVVQMFPETSKTQTDTPMFTMQNIYTIAQAINVLTKNRVTSPNLEVIHRRCEEAIQSFESNYTFMLELDSDDAKEYERKFGLIIEKYADKDEAGEVIVIDNKIMINDPKKKQLCDNSIEALKEEYKEHMEKFQKYKNMMDYTFSNVSLPDFVFSYITDSTSDMDITWSNVFPQVEITNL